MAVPKADIKLNINHYAIVQRTELIGTTPVIHSRKVLDRATGLWTEENDLVNKNIFATTSNVANVNTYHNVKIDLTTRKAIKYVEEGLKRNFGI